MESQINRNEIAQLTPDEVLQDFLSANTDEIAKLGMTEISESEESRLLQIITDFQNGIRNINRYLEINDIPAKKDDYSQVIIQLGSDIFTPIENENTSSLDSITLERIQDLRTDINNTLNQIILGLNIRIDDTTKIQQLLLNYLKTKHPDELTTIRTELEELDKIASDFAKIIPTREKVRQLIFPTD